MLSYVAKWMYGKYDARCLCRSHLASLGVARPARPARPAPPPWRLVPGFDDPIGIEMEWDGMRWNEINLVNLDSFGNLGEELFWQITRHSQDMHKRSQDICKTSGKKKNSSWTVSWALLGCWDRCRDTGMVLKHWRWSGAKDSKRLLSKHGHVVGFLCVPHKAWVQRCGNTEQSERSSLQRLFALVSMPPCIGKSCRKVENMENMNKFWCMFDTLCRNLLCCKAQKTICCLANMKKQNLCNIWTAWVFLSAVWEGCSPLGEQPCPAHLTNDHPLSKMSMSVSVHTFLYMRTDGYIVVYLYLYIYTII